MTLVSAFNAMYEASRYMIDCGGGNFFPGIRDHSDFMWHPVKVMGTVKYGWFKDEHLQPSFDAPENISARCE